MKSVLISIRPKWCELIAQGKKTVEVRKTRPKIETPFKCYIYCTKDNTDLVPSRIWWKMDKMGFQHILNGMVIGEFVCDRIRCEHEIADGLVDIVLESTSFVGARDLLEYANGNVLYSWHISNFVLYDKPNDLSDFHQPIMPSGLRYENDTITRPPQSWCYVEKLK